MAGEPDSARTTKRAIPQFDDDCIAEILSRLPAKSLLRFRCVRKSWRALISDPSFVKQHLINVVNTNHSFNLLLGTRPSHASVIEEYDADGDVAIKQLLELPVTSAFLGLPMIYGSCNGLICMEFEKGMIILWNPCTREFKQLPQPKDDYGVEGDFNSGVEFAGFGYDSTIGDYKVIRGTKYFEEPFEIQVFTFKTRSWRSVTHLSQISDDNLCDILQEQQGFLLNETLHWAAYLGEGTFGIVSIGLTEAKFQVMGVLPNPIRYLPPNDFMPPSILMVGNSLIVYHEFGIWVMKEYGVDESWVQVAYISPEILPQGFSSNILRGLCILENGEVIIRHGQALGVYDPKEKTFTSVIWNAHQYSRKWCVGYMETLVSPLNCIGASM